VLGYMTTVNYLASRISKNRPDGEVLAWFDIAFLICISVVFLVFDTFVHITRSVYLQNSWNDGFELNDVLKAIVLYSTLPNIQLEIY
jgi:hypothetical protein